MTKSFLLPALTCVALLAVAPLARAQDAPLVLASAKVSIAGTSNIHEFTATTSEVRVTRVALANGVAGLSLILNPGAVDAFVVAIRASSLSSPKEGLDKNMHKALKVDQHADIVFRLARLEGTPGALKAAGTLQIAGVERQVVFDLKATITGATIAISGEVPVVMTDYGIKPPVAMLGMLKTDPKVIVRFETVLAAPTTLTR